MYQKQGLKQVGEKLAREMEWIVSVPSSVLIDVRKSVNKSSKSQLLLCQGETRCDQFISAKESLNLNHSQYSNTT